MGRTCTGPAPRLGPWCRKLGQSSDRGVRWTDARTAAGEYRAEGLSASVPRAPTRGGWSHAIARPRTSRLRAARRAHHRQQSALSQPVGAGTVATISIGPAISMVGPDAPAERPPSGACLVCHVAVLTQPSLEKPRASIDARAAREQGERDHAAKERQGCLRDRGGHAGPCHRRELGWRQVARGRPPQPRHLLEKAVDQGHHPAAVAHAAEQPPQEVVVPDESMPQRRRAILGRRAGVAPSAVAASAGCRALANAALLGSADAGAACACVHLHVHLERIGQVIRIREVEVTREFH